MNIAISIIYISRTLSSKYYELYHLHLTNSIIYISRTPSSSRRARECPFTTQTPTCSVSQVLFTTLTYPVTSKSHELTNFMIYTSRTLSLTYLSRTHRLNNSRSFTLTIIYELYDPYFIYMTHELYDQHTATHCKHTATHCNMLHATGKGDWTMYYYEIIAHCKHTATHCNTLQTHCNTLQTHYMPQARANEPCVTTKS